MSPDQFHRVTKLSMTTIATIIFNSKKIMHFVIIVVIFMSVAIAIAPNNTKIHDDDLLLLFVPKEYFSLARRLYQSYCSTTLMRMMTLLGDIDVDVEYSNASFDRNTKKYSGQACHSNPHRSSNTDSHTRSLIKQSTFFATRKHFDASIAAES